jgi:hypothetical protein
MESDFCTIAPKPKSDMLVEAQHIAVLSLHAQAIVEL